MASRKRWRLVSTICDDGRANTQRYLSGKNQ